MIKRLCIMMILSLSTLLAAGQTGTWSGKLDVQGSKLSLVFHLDGENPTMDSPDQGAKGTPILIEKTGTGGIKIRIPSLGASYEGVWMFKQIVGTFKQMNISLPLTLTPGDDKPARPQTPTGPFPYGEEEVAFKNGEMVLNGTLVLPEGYSHETPVIVMVIGSGIQNRDEELFEHKPFAVIADALARAGIATLRYDDRGYGDKRVNPLGWTTDDFKEDAQAAITMLRERFDKVGALGHSEGGTITIMLAAEKQADFIISLAGVMISGAETLIYQNRFMLLEAGVPEETVSTYCRLLKEAFDVTVKGGIMPNVDNHDLPKGLKQNFYAVLNQIQMPYMRYFLSLDVRPVLDDVTCPVLAVNGTKDIQVEYSTNLGALNDGLGDKVRNRIVSVDGVNHLFQHCTTGAISEYREIEETISPKVLEMIVEWVSGLR